MILKIEEREYDLLGELKDEKDCLDTFIGNGYSGYVCDVISEVADSFVPIYYNDIWEYARDIKEYIEEAQAQGLVEGVTDLEKIFQAGYYQYYTQSIYDNLDTLAFNRVADLVNEHLNGLEEEFVDNLDIDSVEYEIESQTNNFDNNKRMDYMDDIAKSIINEIDNGVYNIEETEEIGN